MKQRLLAAVLVLLLLAVTFVTGVFASSDLEDESTEPVVTVPEPETTAPPEAVASSEDTQPAETEASTEPAETEPAPSAESDPPATEPSSEPDHTPPSEPEPGTPQEKSGNRLTIHLEPKTALNQDLLFTVRGETFALSVVIPAGASDVTVVGLPEGYCTVCLDNGWNWLLKEEDFAAQTVSFDGSRSAQTMVFRPAVRASSWLNASAGGDGK